MPFATQPVRRVAAAEGIRPSGIWPHTIPAVHQLLTEGLDLTAGVTFLVGENGAGKSTIVEAVAMAFGMSPEGGSTGARLTTRETESSLSRDLQLTRVVQFQFGVGRGVGGAGRWWGAGVVRYTLARGVFVAGGHDRRSRGVGLRRTTWDELELVQNWKAYLQAPERYLRHIV
ncbi:AAA family ATPase [Kribbella sp. NPDC004536]|uniref:AAA family ATPase n=1 Tax=Kribbella sp. NPDC004536 TaxID=3364106 RepID=UPI0036974E4D